MSTYSKWNKGLKGPNSVTEQTPWLQDMSDLTECQKGLDLGWTILDTLGGNHPPWEGSLNGCCLPCS